MAASQPGNGGALRISIFMSANGKQILHGGERERTGVDWCRLLNSLIVSLVRRSYSFGFFVWIESDIAHECYNYC